ncbi:MAG: SusC/RagA family TonB-linked outer membrane protein [Prolixibacteraceae bacterium]|nr:SusC/RagA family TonB-linked outer membrane protein [Prolixibacteraceae bacterium]
MKKIYIVSLNKILLCLVILAIGAGWLVAQTKPSRPLLSGKVIDTFGNPVAGAEVRLQDSDKATLTNLNGDFVFGVNDINAVLEISHLGFATLKVTKGEINKMEIILQKDVSNKDRIISTLYDQRPDYSVTAAVATVSGAELNKTPYMNLAAALAGRLPGLIVRQYNAEPGSEDYYLNIRGMGTPNGRSPIVLIDGVVSDNLQTINPRDVESVTILKDAAATVLYGMQGGNGIISVVTKRGDFGKPRISVNVDQSIQQAIKTPDMLHSREYAALRNEAYKNDGYGDNYIYSNAQADGYLQGTNRNIYPDNNWYKTFVKPFVQSQRYNVSASGGSDALKYYSNLAYTHVGGPFKVEQNDFNPRQSIDRFNFRTNVDVKLNNYISSFMNISGIVQRTNGSTSANGTILTSIFNLPPTLYGPLTPEDQVIATPQETNPTYGLINRSGYRKQTSTKMNAILGLNMDLSFIVKGLSTRVSAMFDASANSNINGTTGFERWIRDEASYPDSLAFIKQGTQLNTPLSLTKGVTYSYMSDMNWLLRYNKKWGKQTIGAMGFARYQYENHAELDIKGILPYKRMTYGAHFNYGFSNLLFADFAASYEGSEQFAPGHRYGLFPAGSVAWVISNHEFLKDNKFVTNLKVRASFGVVGNDELFGTRNLYLDNISQTGTKFISSLGGNIEENQRGNPLLTWEKARKANIGIELGVSDQFTFVADFFREDRDDILVNRSSVPASQGLPSASLAPINIGRVLNQGFEVKLGYNKTFNKDFSIGIQTYLDYNKNIIKANDEVKLGEDYAYRYRSTGYNLFQIWGYLIDKTNGNGYFNSQQEITNSGLIYDGRAPRPGDFIYKDLNGDKVIDTKDIAPIGYPVFPRISWGTNVNLTWKNFDAAILFQGIGQVSQSYSGMGFYDYTNGGTYFNMHRDAWTAERFASGAEITSPALSSSQSASNRINDFYVLNKQYVRLKNVEIGYQLPASLANKVKTESIRVYVSGYNLLTIDRLGNSDLDPEMGDITTFPTNRTWNIGLNVTF